MGFPRAGRRSFLPLVLALAAAAPRAGDPVEARVARGREALAAGDRAAATTHFERALAFRPSSPELLELLFEASADPDARAWWARLLRLAATDARGRTSLARELQAALSAAAPEAEPLLRARFAAIDELAALAANRQKSARRRPDAAVAAWWARNLAWRLARPAPASREKLEPEFAPGVELPRELPPELAKELKRALSSALSSGRAGEAVRAARILAGLGNQASSEDLQGDAPAGAKELEAVGREGLAKARERLRASSGEPWTLARLEELEEEAALAFTREHSDASNPGVALSPTGLYRVETTCGHETLLGAVATVEEHHRRLARWYGRDPFEGRPGLVRILPEASGLESESTPFWWAGGFQSGDLTVLRFACGTIPELGRLLVHELTHRFDGALFPGIPAWLAEGRAVWTASAYRYVESEELDERAVDVGTIEAAFLDGYGAERKLRELIEGEIEDYRDNYVAGYALYVYLRSWEEDGRRPFAARLEPYMRDVAKARAGAVAWFEEQFADGREGRPEGLSELARSFADFLQGFYWETRAPWLDRYETELEGERAGPVYDEPTWTWSRARAEPYFGEAHAWEAGRLFEELGRGEDALAAYAWALAVDERRPARMLALADFFARMERPEAAWVLRNEPRRWVRRAGDGLADPAPMLGELPRVRAYLDELERAAGVARGAGRALCAATYEGERDVLAAALGTELPARVLPAFDASRSVHEPWRLLGADGWEEASLTGYEDRRVADLWYADEEGDLHVGRERPRAGTGALDRAAHQRDAIALSTEWQQPGRYRVRCRVQFTTSFVSGALVLGWTRRDRSLRVRFSAGDFLYAIGKKEDAEVLEGVHWGVDGLRVRDGGLAGSLPGGEERFEEPRAHFALEVVVDGALADVWIEGRRAGTYHAPDGAPIEGRVGFATSFGAIRVLSPEVQRLDATAALDRDPDSTAGVSALERLDLGAPPERGFDELVGRSVVGLAPSPRGTLLVWIPAPEVDAPEDEIDGAAILERARSLAERADRLLERECAAQPIVLVLPSFLGADALAALERELAPLRPEGLRVLAHPGEPRVYDPEGALPGSMRTWLCFVDSAGALRIAWRFHGFFEELPPDLAHWLAVFREHAGPR